MLQKGMQVYTCFKDRETLIFDDPSMQKQLFSYSEGSDFHRKIGHFWKHFLDIPQNQFFEPLAARVEQKVPVLIFWERYWLHHDFERSPEDSKK